MPTTTLKTISKVQPMREGEIAVVDYLNGDLSNYLTEETNEREQADVTLQNNIDAESERAKEAEQILTNNLNQEISDRKAADNTLQQNIDAEKDRATAAEKKLTTDLATEVTNRTNADNTLQQNIDTLSNKFPVKESDIADTAVSYDKLNSELQAQIDFIITIPTIEFGKSNTIDVSGSSSQEITINFASTKPEAPIVFCGLQHASGKLACTVTHVTNMQFSVSVYNLATTDITGVTVDWLAISGR